MGQVTIVIDKREYAITCDDGQEAHIIKLSRILDEKAKLLSSSVGLINENMMLAMVGLLLADELQDIKTQNPHAAGIDLQPTDRELAAKIDRQSERLRHLIQDIKPL